MERACILRFASHTVTLVCALLLVAACSKFEKPVSQDPVYPIYFLQKSYEIRQGIGESISYYNGGKLFDVSITNDAILDADIDTSRHTLAVMGKEKGETIISVTDRQAETTVRLNFKVVPSYLCFLFADGTLPLLNQRIPSCLCLVNDSVRTFYLLRKADDANLPLNDILLEGTYKTEVKDNLPIITFYFVEDGKTRSVTYGLKGSSAGTFTAMNKYLNCGWSVVSSAKEPGKRTDRIPDMLVLSDNDKRICIFLLSSTRIPEGILKD